MVNGWPAFGFGGYVEPAFTFAQYPTPLKNSKAKLPAHDHEQLSRCADISSLGLESSRHSLQMLAYFHCLPFEQLDLKSEQICASSEMKSRRGKADPSLV